MPASISPRVNGYLVDTNVLSLLARAGQLGLLQYIAVPLYITPTIKQELAIGIQRGVDYLNNVLTLSENGTLQTLAPTETDSQLVKRFPNKLGQGEAEAIVICRRLGMVFITHDRKAINYCDHAGVDCIPLTDLLAEFESAGVLTVTEIAAIFT